MCCVFTCCGWMIDLVQRFWTFAMSCCISSAVCCALFTASMSGIAMGYNYSLAEYIDLKETNVSVFLKRGIFDDEIVVDQDFRRSGNIKDSNMVTNEHEEETMPPKSGRRLDDSVFQSDDHNKFEGSLMKLTAKLPGATQSVTDVTSDEQMAEIARKYPSGSLDQLKAIHSLINMRRANDHRATKEYQASTPSNNFVVLPGGRRVMLDPDSPDKHNILVGDRAIPFEQSTFKLNAARLAVPDTSVVEAPNWFLPKVIPENYKLTMQPEDYDNIPKTPYTYPAPIRYRTDIQRPTKVKYHEVTTMSSNQKIKEELRFKPADTRRIQNSELNRVQNNLLMDKAKFPSFRKPVYQKSSNEDPSKSEDVDYEEEANKGLPMRRKRSTKFVDYNIAFKDTVFIPNVLFNFLEKEKNIVSRNDIKENTRSVDNKTQSIEDKGFTKSAHLNISSLKIEKNSSGNNIFDLSVKRENESIKANQSKAETFLVRMVRLISL